MGSRGLYLFGCGSGHRDGAGRRRKPRLPKAVRRTATPVANDDIWRLLATISEYEPPHLSGLSRSVSSYTTTEGQWQQLQVVTSGSGTLTIQLVHQNWQGDVYWDDVNVERVADSTPASAGTWQGTSWTGTLSGGSATWASSWSGGVGGGPSRQVTISSTSTLTDIRDALPVSVLRSGASYVISL